LKRRLDPDIKINHTLKPSEGSIFSKMKKGMIVFSNVAEDIHQITSEKIKRFPKEFSVYYLTNQPLLTNWGDGGSHPAR
jgi:hypothetical protein